MDQLKQYGYSRRDIGAGKTTLANKLSHHYGWRAEFEAVEDNPYLVAFLW